MPPWCPLPAQCPWLCLLVLVFVSTRCPAPLPCGSSQPCPILLGPLMTCPLQGRLPSQANHQLGSLPGLRWPCLCTASLGLVVCLSRYALASLPLVYSFGFFSLNSIAYRPGHSLSISMKLGMICLEVFLLLFLFLPHCGFTNT